MQSRPGKGGGEAFGVQIIFQSNQLPVINMSFFPDKRPLSLTLAKEMCVLNRVTLQISFFFFFGWSYHWNLKYWIIFTRYEITISPSAYKYVDIWMHRCARKKKSSPLICKGFSSGPYGLLLCLEDNQFFFKYSDKIQPSEKKWIELPGQ